MKIATPLRTLLPLAVLAYLPSVSGGFEEGSFHHHEDGNHPEVHQCLLFPVPGVEDEWTWSEHPDPVRAARHPFSISRSGPSDASNEERVTIAANDGLPQTEVPTVGSSWPSKFTISGEWRPTVPGSSALFDDRILVKAYLTFGGVAIAAGRAEVQLRQPILLGATSYSFREAVRIDLNPVIPPPDGHPLLNRVGVDLRIRLNDPFQYASPGTLDAAVEMDLHSNLVVPTMCDPTSDDGKKDKRDKEGERDKDGDHHLHEGPSAQSADLFDWGPAVVTATMGIAGVSYFRPRGKP